MSASANKVRAHRSPRGRGGRASRSDGTGYGEMRQDARQVRNRRLRPGRAAFLEHHLGKLWGGRSSVGRTVIGRLVNAQRFGAAFEELFAVEKGKEVVHGDGIWPIGRGHSWNPGTQAQHD